MKNKARIHLWGGSSAAGTVILAHLLGPEGVAYWLLFLVFAFGSIWIWTGECPISYRPTEDDKREFRDNPFGMASERPPEEDHFWDSFKRGKRPWENAD
ncbi:hypothetical protein HBA54_04850 [Pelagibius litoralis]|uniref:Uncharacterized protein n=2 Tax=Pelagibius litoralis TaxID=374515 RepID=A0A967C3Q3_9PROT|nr:hypothetical protein [Pelagibius litoralis]